MFQGDVDDPDVVLSPPRRDGPVEAPVSGECPARGEMTERHELPGRDQPPAVPGGVQLRTDPPRVADLGGDRHTGERHEHGGPNDDANGTAPHEVTTLADDGTCRTVVVPYDRLTTRRGFRATDVQSAARSAAR